MKHQITEIITRNCSEEYYKNKHYFYEYFEINKQNHHSSIQLTQTQQKRLDFLFQLLQSTQFLSKQKTESQKY